MYFIIIFLLSTKIFFESIAQGNCDEKSSEGSYKSQDREDVFEIRGFSEQRGIKNLLMSPVRYYLNKIISKYWNN